MSLIEKSNEKQYDKFYFLLTDRDIHFNEIIFENPFIAELIADVLNQPLFNYYVDEQLKHYIGDVDDIDLNYKYDNVKTAIVLSYNFLGKEKTLGLLKINPLVFLLEITTTYKILSMLSDNNDLKNVSIAKMFSYNAITGLGLFCSPKDPHKEIKELMDKFEPQDDVDIYKTFRISNIVIH